MRDMPGGHVQAGILDIVQGIIEENIGAKRLQEWPFVATAQKQRFVQAHAPLAQSENHPFVCRRRTRRHQCGPDR